MLLVRGWANRALPPRNSVGEARFGRTASPLPAEVIQPRTSLDRNRTGSGTCSPVLLYSISRKAAGRIALHSAAHPHTHTHSSRQTDRATVARRHSSKEVVTPPPPPPPPPPATPNLHPGLTGGEGRGRLCYPVKVWLFPKSRQTRKKRAKETRGRDRRRSTKGRWPCTPLRCAQREGQGGRGKDPAHCLPRRAQQLRFFFVAAALPFPLCASYLHPQDGKHNTDCAAAAAAAAA